MDQHDVLGMFREDRRSDIEWMQWKPLDRYGLEPAKFSQRTYAALKGFSTRDPLALLHFTTTSAVILG